MRGPTSSDTKQDQSRLIEFFVPVLSAGAGGESSAFVHNTSRLFAQYAPNCRGHSRSARKSRNRHNWWRCAD